MDISLWSLFISAFISSTLFPGGSEAVIGYLASADSHSPATLIAIAGTGNTLGGMTSWALGRIIAIKYPSQALHNTKHLAAIRHIKKWGGPVLLFSWVPIVGDPLCVAAGWLRIHWLFSLVFIAVGKIARYTVIVFAFSA